MKPNVKEGDRIELTCMENDPHPIEVGTKGTVVGGSEMPYGQYQLWVKWDNGRSLNLIWPEDKFLVIPT